MAVPLSLRFVDWFGQCAAVIPCFNEADTIGPVVSGCQAHLSKVIVADDGSTDGSAQVARAAGAEVILHPANHGKGAALIAGWGRARELGFRWALSLDADGQHSPDDIPAFFERAEHSSAVLVIGNRMGQADKMPWLRHVVNRFMSWLLERRAGMRLPDTQCGYRLLDLDTLAKLELRSTHFEIESELLMATLALRGKVEFVEVKVGARTGKSRIRPLVDGWRWLKWWLSLRAR
jgi:glycosyltransferase involved in cell wall biosynthesis